MANLTEEILKAVEDKGSLDTYEYATATGKDHQTVVGVIKSIQALGDVSFVSLAQTDLFSCRPCAKGALKKTF